MRIIQILLLALVAFLQYRYWLGENGYADKQRLTKEVIELQQQLDEQRAINDQLNARVIDLKSGNDAIEELARQELGLVKPDEVYIVINEAD
ncbi:septum formation initiator family protein [Reinekea thalattae]|uniref:Cell division protein FtsB n=1 Tax=Reinekea thalattae TaxID=2593301 RepID=A0A5C8Z9K3_9GAMM|nr:septum formation initiator family protein [Reinekea thalattae]TXR54064.1 cell division protein FtsB [Reinekea thalattae]